MKTTIRLAGDKWQNLKDPKPALPAGTLPTDDKVLWRGEMPMVVALGFRVVDESKDDPKLYYATQLSIHFNNEEMWQTVFVMPKPM